MYILALSTFIGMTGIIDVRHGLSNPIFENEKKKQEKNKKKTLCKGIYQLEVDRAGELNRRSVCEVHNSSVSPDIVVRLTKVLHSKYQLYELVTAAVIVSLKNTSNTVANCFTCPPTKPGTLLES